MASRYWFGGTWYRLEGNAFGYPLAGTRHPRAGTRRTRRAPARRCRMRCWVSAFGEQTGAYPGTRLPRSLVFPAPLSLILGDCASVTLAVPASVTLAVPANSRKPISHTLADRRPPRPHQRPLAPAPPLAESRRALQPGIQDPRPRRNTQSRPQRRPRAPVGLVEYAPRCLLFPHPRKSWEVPLVPP
ncbi:hypothetical protein PtA15_9A650 [Puccinia triticina]|uniref:Uncharacterized protein n=1 Tax=Puccinia triticina TaxID=208348 RepID=A0ABY7CTB3_9BASI|nr:uncharacterized protein PtA15_9A650 [Puccinia triticina]WAQ88523.1 hypothetical protein PtA15_9A650 [Puccinia triticina]